MRSTAYAIIFGPRCYGGAGFIRWSTIQGEGQILLFLKHWRASDTAGKLLRVGLGWAQFQAGTSRSILYDVTTPLPHLESRWIPSLRRFLQRISAHLELDNPYIPPLQRHGDQYIMDFVIDSGHFQPEEILLINYCRLYLDVITLSDVTTACGCHLDPDVQLHTRPHSSVSKYHHPVQQRPNQWALWDRVLTEWFHPTGQMKQPLGSWYYSAPQLRRHWQAYLDSQDGYIYIQQDSEGPNQFIQCHASIYPYVSLGTTSWHPTSTSYPVNPSRPLSIHPPLPTPPISDMSLPPTFQDYVQRLPSFDQGLLLYVQFLVDEFQLETYFRPCTSSQSQPTEILVVSDGSHKDTAMSFGWVIALPDGTRIATGVGPGYGSSTSHRAEAYGVLSAVRFFHHIQRFLSCHASWRVHFHTDNQGLITQITNRQKYDVVYANSTLAADWDLVEEIVSTLSLLPLRSQFSHVKGHQDNTHAYEDLELTAQLNVDADTLAGTYEPTELQPDRVHLYPTTKANLFIAGASITRSHAHNIRHAAAMSEYLPYIRCRNTWTTKLWSEMDHPILTQLINKNQHRHVNVVKFLHNRLPTAAVRQYTEPTLSPGCTRCLHPKETFSHLLQCSHPSRAAWRDDLLLAIHQYCSKTTTRIPLIQILQAGLRHWFDQTPLDLDEFGPEFRLLIRDQNSIGWYGFLRGFVSPHWASIQHNHLRKNDLVSPQRTGTLWLVGLLQLIWDRIFVLWETYITELHGSTEADHHRTKRTLLCNRIQSWHDRQDELRPEDHCWLIPDLPTYLQSVTLRALNRWLETYEPILRDSILLAKTAAVAQTKPLRHYFPSTYVPTTSRHLKSKNPSQD